VTIAVEPVAIEWLAEELAYVGAKAASSAARETLDGLERELHGGTISDDRAEVMGYLLGHGLVSGRIRAVYGAHAEMQATALYAKTPQGKVLGKQFSDANSLFKALEGHTIRGIHVSARGPGLYSLTIETDEARVVTAFDGSGIDVRSVEVSY